MQFDIVFLGSGISCTQTLLQLLAKLEKETTRHAKIKIAVVEKDGEFWKGVAYGKKSSVNSLIITTLAEFIPADEKDMFLNWLKTHQAVWIAELKNAGGETATHWINHNKENLKKGNWDELYIPRFLYGAFAESRINTAIKNAEKKELVSLTAIKAEAVDISSINPGLYEIKLEERGKEMERIFAKKIVLTTGSGNNKPVPLPPANNDSKTAGLLYINDPYSPSMDGHLQNIFSRLAEIKDQEKRNILVLGSNASSLELLYFMSTKSSLTTLLNKVVVISRSGMLAHRITPNHFPGYIFHHLESLKQAKQFDAEKLFYTIQKDVQEACSKNIALGDMVDKLNALVVELLNLLGADEEKEFYSLYGSRFSKLIRRAGAEYRDGAQQLLDSGKLSLLKGSFLKIKNAAPGANGVMLEYEIQGSKIFTYPLSFPVVINCGGFEDLEESSSPLIANLVNKKLCAINKTRRGFEVSENFEAAENLYVMGPLLGGIFNNKVKHWHVENLKRIHDMAPALAGELVKSLRKKSAVTV